MKKYIYLFLLTTASFMTFGCKNDAKPVAADQSPAVKVKVNKVVQSTQRRILAVSGKIQPINSAELSTRMMGFVTKSPVKIGDKVKKGQLLISINNRDLQAQSAQAKASISEASIAVNNAEKDYHRYKNLAAKNSATQKELDDITAQFEMAKARLEAAIQMKNEINAQFAYSNITAPFNGIVTAKTVELGDMANPGTPLISIESTGGFEVMAMVPETEITKITKDSQVNVTVKSIHKNLTGYVSEISRSANYTGGQYLVKIHLDTMETDLRSGMFATVQFSLKENTASGMVLLPKEALITKGQLTGVYTVNDNNTAQLRWLRLGRTYGEQIEVLSGLTQDETYIISAEGRLYNGVNITIQ